MGGGSWAQARGIYAELWDFIRHPRWIDSQRRWDGLVWRQLFLLFLLDVAVLVVAMLLITGYTGVLDLLRLPAPAVSSEDGDSLDAISWLVTGVILAPLIEEVACRGWLRGTPRALLLLVVVLGVWGLDPLVAIIAKGGSTALAVQLALGLSVLGALVVLWRGGGPVPFFLRHFAWFYWISCLWFAQIHLGNYETGNTLLTLPMLLPQFLAGVCWGFARMRFGFAASILLHAAANGILLVPIMLAGG